MKASHQLTIFGTYANTTKLSGPQLLQAVDSSDRQREKLLLLFQRWPSKRFAPHEFAPIFPTWPITSIRRALSYMAKDGHLIKSQQPEKTGEYGRPVHTWRLNTEHPINTLFKP